MSKEYKLKSVSRFKRDFKAFSRKNRAVAEKITFVLELLEENPFNSRLDTHSVRISVLGKVYSSRVTGDIRIIWFFLNEGEIVLYRIGGHSGGSNVYR